MIHVVVGLLFDANHHLLVAERASHKYQGGRWEFPGGKIEEGETAFDALQRELKEEVAVDVITAEPWWQIQHDYSDKIIFLDIWKVTQFEGIARGVEGQTIRWVTVDELGLLPIPDANRAVLQRLAQHAVIPRSF